MGRARQRAQLLAGTVARVGMPGLVQTAQGVGIQPHAGALDVRPRRAPDIGAFVPIQSEPMQIADDRVGVPGP